MSTKPQELNKVIADLRQIIVGQCAMPHDQIEQITLFLFLKQLSRKHDDLVRLGAKEGLIFVKQWERYHFDILMRHSGEELVKECSEAIESLYKNPNIDKTVRQVFERSYLRVRNPKVLSSFLQYLNDKFSDGLDLGDFYESLLPILGTQNELGQFRTPRHIIDFIVRVVDPNIGEKIADPACGTAGFLVAAFNYLKEKYTDEKGRLKLNPDQTKKLYNETIFGWDMEPLMVKFSLANLYLHGLKVPNVSENDTLLNENLWQHTFDIIVANPPFITPKDGARRHSRFAITSNKTEVLFCEYMVHHLNFNGRMGVIVPEGIVFDASKGHKSIRKLFLDNGLWCVVSLPSGVFQPYAGVKTYLIFLDKTLKPEQILFFDVENHGFSLNANPSPIEKNDLPNALKIIKNYKENQQNGKPSIISEDKYYTIPITTIFENNTLDLRGGTYRRKNEKSHDEWSMTMLSEVLDYEQPTKYIVSSENYDDKFKTPVLTAGKTFVLGYTNEKEGIYNKELPVIIFDDFTTATKLVDFPFKVKSSAMKILHAKKEKANIKFLFYMMQAIIFPNSTHKRYWISEYSKIKIPFPPLEIQKQIVAELENYQKVIDGARAVVENWRPIFEADLNWKKHSLRDVCIFENGKAHEEHITDNGKYIVINSKFIASDGIVKKYTNKSLKPLKTGDVVMVMSDVPNGRALAKCFLVDKNDTYTLNQRIGLFRPKEIRALDPAFLYFQLNRNLYLLKFDNHQSQTNLRMDQILDCPFYLPPLEIQKQIVAKIEEERKVVEANKKLIDLFQQKIEAKIKSIYG